MSRPRVSTVVAAVVFVAASTLYLAVGQPNDNPAPPTPAPATSTPAR